MTEGRRSRRASLKEAEMVLQGEKCVMYRSCDSLMGYSNNGRVSSNCQSGVVLETDLLRTRSGWQASKAARNDLGPDILSLSNPKATMKMR